MNSLAKYRRPTLARARPVPIRKYHTPSARVVVAPILGAMAQTIGWCTSLATQAYRNHSERRARWIESSAVEPPQPLILYEPPGQIAPMAAPTPLEPPAPIAQPQTYTIKRKSLLEIFD